MKSLVSLHRNNRSCHEESVSERVIPTGTAIEESSGTAPETPRFPREESLSERAIFTDIPVDETNVAQEANQAALTEEPNSDPAIQVNPDGAQGDVLDERETTELQKELEGVAKLKSFSQEAR